MIEAAGSFQWDLGKSERCFAARGFSFAYAVQIWLGPVFERVDDRKDYGEARIQALGRIGGQYFVVVYTWRGVRRHIISARRAHEKEAVKWGVL